MIQINVGTKKSRCNICHKIGHIDRACRNRNGNGSNHRIDCDDTDEYDFDVLNVNGLDSCNKVNPPIITSVLINNFTTLDMEIDTGSSNSLISEKTYLKHFGTMPLENANNRLSVYNQTQLTIIGKARVQVNGIPNLWLYVVKEDGPSLIGRDWLQFLRLDWKTIFSQLKDTNACEQVEATFSMKMKQNSQNSQTDELLKEFKN